MNILLTNDDGYDRKALAVLVSIMKRFGDVTVVAPKTPQSGMSLSVSMGFRPIAVKKLKEVPGERWWYLDGTPASCVKYGIDNVFLPEGRRPDLVVSGINYGANFATAALYSGTIGAVEEAAVNGIPGIGVSLDDFSADADFSAFGQLLPGIMEKLIPHVTGRGRKHGEFYNINFPALPACRIKGIKAGKMGFCHWEDEYKPYDVAQLREKYGFNAPKEHLDIVAAALPGEEFLVMAGDMIDEEINDSCSDNRIVKEGYISITAHNMDNSDKDEAAVLNSML